MHFFDDDDYDDDDDYEIGNSKIAKNSNTPVNIVEIRDCLPSNIGGRRGLFSLSAIPAGTLIISERPVKVWGCESFNMDDSIGLIAIIKDICSDSNIHIITKDLYPMSIDDADVDEVDKATALLDDCSDIVDIICNTNNGIDMKEIIRLFLVLQHNGFDSGLYQYLTKVNHSCLPNCIKFKPTTGSLGISEIWSTRPISDGEEITICYCTPIEMTKESMHLYLKQQHRFICSCSRCIDTTAANGSKNGRLSLQTAKFVLNEEVLQETLEAIEREIQWMSLDDAPDIIARCSTLNKKAARVVSLFDDAYETSPMIKARTYKASVDIAALLLQSIELLEKTRRKKPKEKVIVRAAISYLTYSISLQQEQAKYLGNDHPDLARTFFDISNALACMKTSFFDHISIAFPIERYPWSCSSSTVQKAIADYENEGSRIKMLYSPSKYIKIRTMLAKAGSHYLASKEV